MSKSSVQFSVCSLLMATIFAYSASVQLNDPDWYLWFPLYACACVVNLVNWAISSQTIIRQVAKITLLVGIFMFFKVVIEDFIGGIAGFWCLDLSERVVREKVGSGLVMFSMLLHLKAADLENSMKMKKTKLTSAFDDYGMTILVAFSLGLPFVFFVVKNGEMKFDSVTEH
ncbi:hypothetical protein M5689_012491 [Euphorbia peplus]|nr:hypothetical protein M5689_012491 [Euphorbia peplus]